MARVLVAYGMSQAQELLAERFEVSGEAVRFVVDVESCLQPAVVRRDASRAVVSMTLLGLNAADRYHRFPGDVDDVAAHG